MALPPPPHAVLCLCTSGKGFLVGHCKSLLCHCGSHLYNHTIRQFSIKLQFNLNHDYFKCIFILVPGLPLSLLPLLLLYDNSEAEMRLTKEVGEEGLGLRVSLLYRLHCIPQN